MRPFRAVQSGKRIELEAWLQLLERPRDMNQELEYFNYNVFSLACDLGHLDMVRHLLELCLDGGQRIDTSAVTFLGLTGWDLAKEYAAQLPEDQSRQEIVALLEEWSHKEHFGPDDPNKLREEAKRNLSRPPVEVSGRLWHWSCSASDTKWYTSWSFSRWWWLPPWWYTWPSGSFRKVVWKRRLSWWFVWSWLPSLWW